MLTYALDRSLRSFDPDGHLRVESNVISAGQVNPYFGEEIPNWQSLGLQRDRVYRLLRDPAELAKAAAAFEGKPLLSVHRPQLANDYKSGIVVGTVHNPVWDGTTLKANLIVWDNAAIAGIESGEQRALSAGYGYTPIMMPGVWNGQAYDGIMRSLQPNHVALVTEGRVSGAIVGDKAISKRSMIVMDQEDDPLDRVCAILREVKLPESNIAKVREHLARMIEQAGAEAAEGNIAQDRAATYRRRFPDAGRLA